MKFRAHTEKTMKHKSARILVNHKSSPSSSVRGNRRSARLGGRTKRAGVAGVDPGDCQRNRRQRQRAERHAHHSTSIRWQNGRLQGAGRPHIQFGSIWRSGRDHSRDDRWGKNNRRTEEGIGCRHGQSRHCSIIDEATHRPPRRDSTRLRSNLCHRTQSKPAICSLHLSGL